ncbi:hypothetical protein F5887DRAFT_925388 [Amanita rubescens]|nr:hypothetical protein F5887DRAFT_925388 [Amanita rubescens]
MGVGAAQWYGDCRGRVISLRKEEKRYRRHTNLPHKFNNDIGDSNCARGVGVAQQDEVAWRLQGYGCGAGSLAEKGGKRMEQATYHSNIPISHVNPSTTAIPTVRVGVGVAWWHEVAWRMQEQGRRAGSIREKKQKKERTRDIPKVE